MGAPKLVPKSHGLAEDAKSKARQDKMLISQYLDRIKKLVREPKKAAQAAQIIEEILSNKK
ncbi:MAG: hypothetical protein KAG61_04795 [Bacteriovoracaceae bacterium]|nr:hypothetical protein [Bacteriovoracaceae bacterium]